MDTVFACMAIMAVVTLVAEFLITLLEKRVLSWRPPSRSEPPASDTQPASHASAPLNPMERKPPCSNAPSAVAAIGALALGVGGRARAAARLELVGERVDCRPSSSWSAASTSRSTCRTSSRRISASTRSTASTSQLSTEQNGGVGAEDAMASGQVDMAGAWYIHTIDFQAKGKDVVDVVQLSGAPGEREMCGTNSGVHSAADFKGKTPRRHRPRLGHRRADPVPRREERRRAQRLPHRSRSAPAPPRSPRSSATPRNAS